jgi:hypothetical protein
MEDPDDKKIKKLENTIYPSLPGALASWQMDWVSQ